MSNLLARTATRRSTPSRRRRTGLAAAVLFAAVPLVAGCGAGFNAATTSYTPGPGNGQVGSVRVNNVWVILDQASGKAEVIGAVANAGNRADQVTSVRAGNTPAVMTGSGLFTGVACRNVVVHSGTAVIPGNSVIDGGTGVNFGQRDCPKLLLQGGTFLPGRATPVTMTFAQAGSITVNALIMPNTGLFAEYNLNGEASPTASASPTPQLTVPATGTPTPGSTSGATLTDATATATASATATTTARATPTASATASEASEHKNTSASATR